MSSPRERHARHYLAQMGTRAGDGPWLEGEWTQIRRAWAWVSGEQTDTTLVVAFARAVTPFLEKGGCRAGRPGAGKGLPGAGEGTGGGER